MDVDVVVCLMYEYCFLFYFSLMDPLPVQIHRFLKEGVLADYFKFSFSIRQYVGEYTFQEA